MRWSLECLSIIPFIPLCGPEKLWQAVSPQCVRIIRNVVYISDTGKLNMLPTAF